MNTSKFEKGIALSEMAAVLSVRLKLLPVEQRLRAPFELFGDKLVLTTSFGPTSAVLLHLISSVHPGVTVLNIRHGHETRQTLDFIEYCNELFPINLKVIQAPHLLIPNAVNREEFARFQQETKIKPLRYALEDTGAWFWASGVMHDETEERRLMAMARVRHGAVAIYPILDWTHQQALQFCLQNDLPINNDYFDPCKGPDQSLECGIHHDN